MKYKTNAYRADQARSIAAARLVAATAGWALQSDPALIPIREDPWFYDPPRHLLVLPGVDGWPYGIAAIQRELRCSALLISEGRTHQGGPTLYAQYRRCAGGQIHDHRGLRFWLHLAQGFWLMADPQDDEPDAACFRLGPSGLSLADPPWRDGSDLVGGLEQANALLGRRMLARGTDAQRALRPLTDKG